MADEDPTRICKLSAGEVDTNQLFDSTKGPEPTSLMMFGLTGSSCNLAAFDLDGHSVGRIDHEKLTRTYALGCIESR